MGQLTVNLTNVAKGKKVDLPTLRKYGPFKDPFLNGQVYEIPNMDMDLVIGSELEGQTIESTFTDIKDD